MYYFNSTLIICYFWKNMKKCYVIYEKNVIYEKINWSQVLQLNQNNVNLIFDNYLKTMNALINSYAPLK